MNYRRPDKEFKNRIDMKVAAMRAAHKQDEQDERDRVERERLLAMAHGLTKAVSASRKRHGTKRTRSTLMAAVMGWAKHIRDGRKK